MMTPIPKHPSTTTTTAKTTTAVPALAAEANTNTNSHLKRPQSTISNSKNTSINNNNNGGLQIKKRPYRRTKRPKNYCDKSTVTTVTTPTGQTTVDHHSSLGDSSNIINGNNSNITSTGGVNPYDAVLGECEDLLKASTEAQRLGRLKMASAYQLLLHTRLVGLGKRFDRSAMMVDQQQKNQ